MKEQKLVPPEKTEMIHPEETRVRVSRPSKARVAKVNMTLHSGQRLVKGESVEHLGKADLEALEKAFGKDALSKIME